MKKYLLIVLVTGFFSCSDKDKKDTLTIQGTVKNADNQRAYLEEVFFVQKPPQTLDTADVKSGKFELESVAKTEGLYRVRLDGGKQFFFINDRPEIKIAGDGADSSIANDQIHSPANDLLYNFIRWMEQTGKEMSTMNEDLRARLSTNPDDSATQVSQQNMVVKMNASMAYLQKFVDTVSHPVVAMFALGYLDNTDITKTTQVISALRKRFPNHAPLAELEKELQQPQTQNIPTSQKPVIGQQAPDITMADTEGARFSLSSLKGKYVLVDFWASWCGPCRDENPNVVAAYNKFKNKNFTVLGVSLDREKSPWVEAIKSDGLAWKHISDLMFWDSEAVKLYGFEGIPYNVLVDPNGVIIASDLRGSLLEETLAKNLK